MRNGACKTGKMEEQVMENDIFSSPSTPSKNLSVHKATVLFFPHWSILVLVLSFTGETGPMVYLGEQNQIFARCFLTRF